MSSSVIQALREKLVDNSLEDSFLLKFLRSKGYNINEAYKSLWNYFQVKKTHPHLFAPPSCFADVFEEGIAGVLNGRGAKGESIIICRPGNWNPNKCNMTHLLGAAVCMQEAQGLDPMTQENGVILIVDMKNTCLSQLVHMTPSIIAFGTNLALETLPIRYKEFHVINSNWVAQTVWALGSGLLEDSIKKSTHFHKSVHRLKDFIPRDRLPKEYGGKDVFSAWKYYTENLLKKEAELCKTWRISIETNYK